MQKLRPSKTPEKYFLCLPFQDTGAQSWPKNHTPLLPSCMFPVEGTATFDVTKGVLYAFAMEKRNWLY